MPQDFEDANLSSDSFDICLLDDFLFLKCLNGDLLIGWNVDSQSHFPKCPLADAFSCVIKIDTDAVLAEDELGLTGCAHKYINLLKLYRYDRYSINIFED